MRIKAWSTLQSCGFSLFFMGKLLTFFVKCGLIVFGLVIENFETLLTRTSPSFFVVCFFKEIPKETRKSLMKIIFLLMELDLKDGAAKAFFFCLSSGGFHCPCENFLLTVGNAHGRKNLLSFLALHE